MCYSCYSFWRVVIFVILPGAGLVKVTIFGLLAWNLSFGQTVDTLAGGGVEADGIPAVDARLFTPRGITYDSAGNLYVADTFDNRIRRIDALTGIITTEAGNGTQGNSGDGGPATAAAIAEPTGLHHDGGTRLFLIDSQNHIVRVVDQSTGIINHFAGNGFIFEAGDGGPAAVAGLGVPTDIGTGMTGFADDGGHPSLAQFDRLRGIAFRPLTGATAVADHNNFRVRIISAEPLPLVDFNVSASTSQEDLDGIIILTGSFNARDLLNSLGIKLPNITFVGKDFFVINPDTPEISAPLLDEVGGDVGVSGNTEATTIDLGALTSVGGSLAVSDNPSVTNVNLVSLTTVAEDFTFQGNFSVLEIDLSSLTGVGGSMSVEGNTSSTNVNLPLLEAVGGSMSVDGNTSSTNIDLSSLAEVGASMSVDGNTTSTNVNLPLLEVVGGSMSVNGNTSSINTDLSSLTDVGGNLSIEDNISLTDLSIESLARVLGDLRLVGNVALSVAHAHSLSAVTGNVVLADTILNVLSDQLDVDGQVTLVEGGGISSTTTVAATMVDNQSGTVAPGSSPGRLILDAPYTQGALATLSIELGGFAPGTDSDLLTILDHAELDGTAQFRLLPHFFPALGDEFLFLEASSIQGSFASLTLPPILQWEIVYTETTATLKILAVGVPTSLNLAAWLESYGLPVDSGDVDSDLDGLNHRLEYALADNPYLGLPDEAPTVQVEQVDGVDHLSLRFRRFATAGDVSLIVEFSNDLV